MCRTKKEHWIREVLSNDEASSDKELVEYFMENHLTKKYALKRVVERGRYMGRIVACNNAQSDIKHFLAHLYI